MEKTDSELSIQLIIIKTTIKQINYIAFLLKILLIQVVYRYLYLGVRFFIPNYLLVSKME